MFSISELIDDQYKEQVLVEKKTSLKQSPYLNDHCWNTWFPCLNGTVFLLIDMPDRPRLLLAIAFNEIECSTKLIKCWLDHRRPKLSMLSGFFSFLCERSG